MKFNYPTSFRKQIQILHFICFSVFNLYVFQPGFVNAFPIYAQQGYENPREATGRIVCANCHLAQKPVEIETPKAVLPNTVFEAIVKIPYESQSQQILNGGTKGQLNIGAVVILPAGFKLAPSNMMSNELKEKTKGIYIQPYSTSKDNILVVGPIPGDRNKEIIFPILSPDPAKDKNAHFFKYPIFVGGNRGRGQVYPTGEKSNNNLIIASANGQITDIQAMETGGFEVTLEKVNKDIIKEVIPKGIELKVKIGEIINQEQALTADPNVGGFGQNETEIVLQSPLRVESMIAFFLAVTISQIFFVLKKKQWEKVQAAEINF
uniref:Cytochrome f n=1 Tax=Balbiania investiens TaxID=111861 RepID=A0A4D6BMJ9_9FLOR|nr:apocytochrome f [Balbiania investiens]QBX88647.1 apocytochrome f [Balbiania investiens]